MYVCFPLMSPAFIVGYHRDDSMDTIDGQLLCLRSRTVCKVSLIVFILLS